MSNADAIVTLSVGQAIETSTACYSTVEPESLIGVEITDMNGQFPEPQIGVFITCITEGRKSFLSAAQARGLAEILISTAARLEAGATSSGVN